MSEYFFPNLSAIAGGVHAAFVCLKFNDQAEWMIGIKKCATDGHAAVHNPEDLRI
jgi:hypothetical protein